MHAQPVSFEPDRPASRNSKLRAIREVASFGLLGTVVAGAAFGWTGHIDVAHWIGLSVGVVGATILKLRRIL